MRSPASTGDSLARSDRPRVGVRVYLFAFFVVVACVPLTILGIVQGKRLAEEAVSDTDRQTAAAATAFSLQISLALTDYLRATESLAAQISAHGGLEGGAVFAALAAHTAPHPEFVGSYAAHINGVSFAHYSRGVGAFPASRDYSSRDYYQELRSTGRSAISRVQIGRVTGSADIQIVSPVRDVNGELRGFVCTSVDLQRLSERARVFTRGLTEGRLLVLDTERRVIADSTREGASLTDVSSTELYAPSELLTVRSGRDDRHMTVRSSVAPITEPRSGWSVIASVPTSVIEQRTSSAQREVLLVALGALTFALGLAVFLAVRLAAPLRALARSATQIAAGDSRELPVVPRVAPRELAQVTAAVRHMVVALRKFAGGLQVLVEERTRELRQINVELADALAKLEVEQNILAADLEQARHFQERLLPKVVASSAIQIATHFRPLEQVGGDIYDVLQLTPSKYRVFLADATGHGVQAAMRTIVIKFEYDRIKREVAALDELLGTLNQRLIELFPDGELHCAAMCADIEVTASGAMLTLCSGGGSPAWIANRETLVELYVGGPLLGVAALPFDPPTRVALEPNTSVVFATDGLFEQMNSSRQRFDAALDGVAVVAARGPDARMRALLAQFDAFLDGQSRADDVTVVVLHVAEQ